MKKFVSLLLSAVIIASMIPFAVTAANAAETTATAVIRIIPGTAELKGRPRIRKSAPFAGG